MARARVPLPPRRRLDVVALVMFLVWLLLAAALASYPPLLHFPANLLGPAGDRVAASLTDAIGVAVGPWLLGWFLWLGLYAAGQSWIRLGKWLVGWGILVGTFAAIADLDPCRWGRPAVSVFGPGGSVGAWGRLTLDGLLTAPLPVIVLGLISLLGFTLVSGGVVRLLATAVLGALSLLEAGADRLLFLFRPSANSEPALAVSRVKAQPAAGQADGVVPLAVATADVDVPIIRHTEMPPIDKYDDDDQEDDADDGVESAVPAVPIHRHVDTIPAAHRESMTLDNSDPGSDLPEGYELPPLSLLADPDPFPIEDHAQKLRERAALLEKTFTDFGLTVRVVGIHTGPVITQYEISLETGLRLNKVTTLADDLALNLGVTSVRIVAPLPGRNTVGLEVPNEHRQTVRLKELIAGTAAKSARLKLPIFLGKDVEGRPLVYDMADMPHLLIAGRTGTGKSVCLNAILNSFLFTRRPDECRLILIDPKKVEFSEYGRIPHLMHPVVTDDKKAEAILAWAVDKMEERYDQLRKARVRNVASYNELGWAELVRRIDPQTEDERRAIPRSMPYIVVVVDEVGDLLMTMKKEVETHIIRLAQKSRAAGIHLILATQKPTVDVITGLIKSNLPARICFQVASRADSAVVLDEKGAEKLLGQGDMLFLQPRTSTIIRGQGAYVDDREIERVTNALAAYEPNFESELLNLKTRDEGGPAGDFGERLRDRDPMYEQAIEVVIREQRGSTSLLQRALGIGYGRASRLIDFMAEDGIVGGYNGSNAREVIVSPEDWEARKRDT